MTRPGDLPDFDAPPVTEVALGVQFDSIEGFLSPHLGLAWDRFRADYPQAEEHPPLMPVFEMFGAGPNPVGVMSFVAQFARPRVLFINQQGTGLFQLQADRLIHNWRKMTETDTYPRFEPLLRNFVEGYERIEATLANAGLSGVVPNQCEIVYVNQLVSPSPDEVHSTVSGLFGGIGETLALDSLGRPEDARFMLRYIVRRGEDLPLGRLIVSAEPVYRLDGQAVIQLSLSVRGRPASATLAGVVGFLEAGRAVAVQSFAELTDKKMHPTWGRVQ